MAQIASEDYVNLLIYLHIDTVTSGFDPALMQKEHRTLRRLNNNNERKFDVMVTFVGNESKGGGKLTPRSTRLRAGVRIVPYDTGASGQYSLSILNEILNIPDGVADKDTFDRSSVQANIDIDKAYDPVEVIQVLTGGSVAPTKEEIRAEIDNNSVKVNELHKLQGLKSGSPMTVTPSSRQVDDIDLEITGDGENTSTVTRQ